MANFGVNSEVGKLRKVIVHRPDLSMKRLTPTNHDELLFDDVLWVERAQWEHDQFVKAMRDRGVEVFYHLDLLGEALAASESARKNVVNMVASEYTVGWSLMDEVREFLLKLQPEILARHLVVG
jgi:arginine deiminase